MARVIMIVGVALLALAAPSSAQDAPVTALVTDRPDYTEASAVVGSGRVQIEGGWTYTGSRVDGAAGEHSWPELLARIGLSKSVEARIGIGLISAAPSPDVRFTGLDDLYLGAKIALGEQRGARPELAVMIQATVPTGDALLTADRVLPGAALLAGWDTGTPWSYAAGLQVNRGVTSGVEVAPSAAVGLQLSGAWKAYGEWFALLPTGTDTPIGSQHYLNGGLALLVSNDLQLDGRVGVGLNDHSDKVFFGLGFAIRR